MRRSSLSTLAVAIIFVTLSVAQTTVPTAAGRASRASTSHKPGGESPNILFIIMDDLGIDQLKVFGYGGATPPAMPNLDTIAHAGIRFRNAWAMPECSPSRAVFFEGRYPLRTNIYAAILTDDLANSQVSPYEYTTPTILHTVGYKSGIFGKFHLGGPENNPFGNGSPHALGWDKFDGFMMGPQPIDTSIGGQFVLQEQTGTTGIGPYTCGFIPNSDFKYGADKGACHFSDGSCTDLSRTEQQPTPGRTCVEQGGLFVPNRTCGQPLTKALDFKHTNAYYVWPRVINDEDGTVTVVPAYDQRARIYISEGTNNAAIEWIKQQNDAHQPWMATVAYSNIHTPYQQPLTRLIPPAERDASGLKCTGNTTANEEATRIISNQMAEAMDTEIGNLFVALGLATFNPDGSLNYHPEATNTMVIMVGDNGTFAPSVKAPFNPNLAKGWVYQTGVWVPLIVAGPQVVSPDREVSAMVNVADIFQFFGEIVGVDVHQVVPPSHILDSMSMMPYITNPNQSSIRTTNFTQTGNNIHESPPVPCVVQLSDPPTCVQLFNVPQLCEFEGGIWYPQYSNCCEVAKSGLYPKLSILPDAQTATRNDLYKLIARTNPSCSNNSDDPPVYELYKINEDRDKPALDNPADNLCQGPCPTGLSGQDLDNYNSLYSSQQATLSSEPPCPGDGNEDKVVDQLDIDDWTYFSQNDGLSSWYDLNTDGFTNGADEDIIMQHLGTNCLQQPKAQAVLPKAAVAKATNRK
jgi:arylsulfatase A-like enzyme